MEVCGGLREVSVLQAYPVHQFNVTYQEAKEIQQNLRTRIDIGPGFSDGFPLLAGGADAAFITIPRDRIERLNSLEGIAVSPSFDMNYPAAYRDTVAIAAVVVYDTVEQRVVAESVALAPAFFPYVPGYLSFREGPAVLAALAELPALPGVMLYDGCGIAHPRGMGLASHMAVLTGIPSVGCAKSLLCGDCPIPKRKRGSWTELKVNGDTVGCCLRTRTSVKPVYVSPGSGVSIDEARELVYSLTEGYRLPEPTRLAHHLVSERKQAIREHVDG